LPSQEKLIKQGIKYTDSLFDEIISRLEKGVKSSDTLEAFLEATKDYTTNNPLVTSGYDKKMLELILQETNNHKFSRPAQKELARVTIENYVGEKIVDVGDDVKESVREIVKDGYNQNLSQDEIAANISNRVSVIKNKRARAIARTEVARTATVSDYIINKERGATHWYVECRNTACPICKQAWHNGWTEANDGSFTPSDTSAGGKGWIGDKVYPMTDTASLPPIHPNCRCVVYFVNENDLPEKGVLQDTPVKQQTTTTTPQVPTDATLKSNLSNDEWEKVQWARSVLSKDFHTDKMKAKAQSTLDELYEKATGETAKPKTEKKTKTLEKPVTQPKTQTQTNSIENMTSQELYDSMTKADKKKYDTAKQKLATVEKNISTIGENDLLLGMKKDRLLEIRQLEQKQRDKLQNKGKRKPKEKVVRTNERTLDNIHKDIDIPVKKLIPTLEKWIDKRCKNTSEFGYHFNIKDGSIIDGLKDGEIRGVKGRIAMADLGAETGSIHSHPRNGMAAPSIDDLETFRCKQQDHHFMVSEHEIWYVHATDRFGIGAMGQQLDLQKAHKECRDKAFKRVEKEVKKGKIEATEEAIAKKLDEYTGDEILKTFNSPPWDKTLTVKRYYR